MARIERMFAGALLALTMSAAVLGQDGPAVFPAPEGKEEKHRVIPTRERFPSPLDQSGNVPILPRTLIFGNPEREGARVSPDGKRLAFLAPVKGVMNVWVGPLKDVNAAKPVTSDERRGIQTFRWAFNSEQILYVQDKGGDENWRLYAVDLPAGKTTDLTPFDKTQARIVQASEAFPDEIVIGLNNRADNFHDLHRLNTRTGAMKEICRNDQYAQIIVDHNYVPRFAMNFNPDGSVAVFKGADGGRSFMEPFFTVPFEDAEAMSFVGFNKDCTKAYLIDSRGRDTAALFEMDASTGKTSLMFEDDRADAGRVMVHPITKAVQGVETEYERKLWSIMDADLQADLFAIRTSAGMGDLDVTSRSLDDKVWTMTLSHDEGSQETWLLERGDLKNKQRKPVATKLFVARPALNGKELAPMHPLVLKSRDGMNLVSYLTLPPSADPNKTGRPSRPVPTVLLVHGGPWARDSWGYNSLHQWLANRGYAVLSVNFRGSTGFGKKFLNAANREWAGKMHDDLIDAVNWAVGQKISDPKKVAIMGGSYGGYATLVGLTFTPDVFACGVDIVGPSNLRTLLENVPPYWRPILPSLTGRVGDIKSEVDRQFLESRSPLARVAQISKPLLIGQGANDPRVKQEESDQIVHAMQAKKIPVTYVLYPDEGHGFVRPPNRLSFFAVAEAFLGRHLGGRLEPIGNDFSGSTITIPCGAEQLPGVQEALSTLKAAEIRKPEPARQ